MSLPLALSGLPKVRLTHFQRLPKEDRAKPKAPRPSSVAATALPILEQRLCFNLEKRRIYPIHPPNPHNYQSTNLEAAIYPCCRFRSNNPLIKFEIDLSLYRSLFHSFTCISCLFKKFTHPSEASKKQQAWSNHSTPSPCRC